MNVHNSESIESVLLNKPDGLVEQLVTIGRVRLKKNYSVCE